MPANTDTAARPSAPPLSHVALRLQSPVEITLQSSSNHAQRLQTPRSKPKTSRPQDALVMLAVSDSLLFTALELTEGLTLKNRVVFAPTTRRRCGDDRTPNVISELYYEKRAGLGVGLTVTEPTAVSAQGYGGLHTSTLCNQNNAAGWKHVVNRVHNKNGMIFLQMAHWGRLGRSSFIGNQEWDRCSIAYRSQDWSLS